MYVHMIIHYQLILNIETFCIDFFPHIESNCKNPSHYVYKVYKKLSTLIYLIIGIWLIDKRTCNFTSPYWVIIELSKETLQ